MMIEVPSNLLLNKIGKPAIYLPTAMVIWGAISACTAAAQSYGGMVAIRFFLGVVEAAYFPGWSVASPRCTLENTLTRVA